MRLFLWLVMLSLVAAIAFAAGRWSAAPPRFEPQPASNSSAGLAGAWQNFVRAQQETLALLLDHRFAGDDRDVAEAYRTVLYGLVGAIESNALQNWELPRFMRGADWTSKNGLDNPDNNYYVARLRDDAEYLVRGTRGTTRGLVFQLLRGQPGVGDAGTSDNIAVLYAEAMHWAADGSFELYIGRRNPGAGRNWLRSADGAETLLVRHTHSDWEERSGELYIERIGAEGERAAPLSSDQLARRLNGAAQALYDRTATWLSLSEKFMALMPRNELSKIRATAGGLVGQYASFGHWNLNEDEALIVSMAPGGADYQGFELGRLWFVSMDYDSHTSSLTLEQSVASRDGRYYFVLSHRDPRIQNWLDIEGHQRGLMIVRWQGLDGAPPAVAQPQVQRVPFSQLPAVLPDDIQGFTLAQRQQQIRQRRRQIQQRFSR